MQTREIEELLKAHSGLAFDEGSQIFSGYLSIGDGDRYNLEIDISHFPKQFPKVKELNERIPPEDDRHVNTDGTLCFTTLANEKIQSALFVKNLTNFIDYVLIPYLQNNSYYESNKKYKFGEYSHDHTKATVETYIDLLDTHNPYVWLRVIDKVVRQSKLRPNDLCYCDSKAKIKNCSDHLERFKNLRKIPREVLADNYFTIEKYINLLIDGMRNGM